MGDFWFGCGFLLCDFFFVGFFSLGHWVLVYCYLEFTLLPGSESVTNGIVGFSFLLSPQLRGSHSLLKPGGLGEDKIGVLSQSTESVKA